jgi:hypothetical protein
MGSSQIDVDFVKHPRSFGVSQWAMSLVHISTCTITLNAAFDEQLEVTGPARPVSKPLDACFLRTPDGLSILNRERVPDIYVVDYAGPPPDETTLCRLKQPMSVFAKTKHVFLNLTDSRRSTHSQPLSSKGQSRALYQRLVSVHHAINHPSSRQH